MQKKKIILIIILFPLLSLIVLSFFFYFSYQKPLQENKEIFNSTPPKEKVEVSKEVKEKYGISPEEILEEERQVYFIDGREIEEYNNFHIRDAEHIRAPDLTIDLVKEKFNLSEEEFDEALFILYCHDGTRSSDNTTELDRDNFKFIIGGVNSRHEGNKLGFIPGGTLTFREEVREKDFTTHIDNLKEEYSDKEYFVIDGRLYNDVKIEGAYDFRIGRLRTEEYNNKLSEIIKQKDKKLVYIAEIYPDLFYAKLLIQRLVDSYGFTMDQLLVVMNQSEELNKFLNEETK
ncbi:hypothetical protein C0584_02530 [Candidatus Parcubacteria bacterium]|nr:MAG: hypothetical protein C0584_02530 [Candidatus Parcubacteria bacterium]